MIKLNLDFEDEVQAIVKGQINKVIGNKFIEFKFLESNELLHLCVSSKN